MASFLTTMLVPLHSSPAAEALVPHCTLKQSSSCVTINTYTSGEEMQDSPSLFTRATEMLRDGLRAYTGADSIPNDRNARTRAQFKPRQANKGTTSYQLRQFAEATLGSGSLRKAVKLPEGEDLNEWLAVNGIHPFHGLNNKRLTSVSGRLLQPNQPSLRINNRVLLSAIMS